MGNGATNATTELDQVHAERVAVETEYTAASKSYNEQRTTELWPLLDALRSLEWVLNGQSPAHHAGHAHVDGWYERDRAAALADARAKLDAAVAGFAELFSSVRPGQDAPTYATLPPRIREAIASALGARGGDPAR